MKYDQKVADTAQGKTEIKYIKDGALAKLVVIWGTLRIKKYFHHNALHHDSKPALQRKENGKLVYECWYKYDQRHRDGKPAEFEYTDGKISRLCWYQNSELHRADGPAVVEYENGTAILEHWYFHGKSHREDGPAMRKKNNNTRVECWFRDDIMHRERGPAYTEYENYQAVVKIWCRHGDLYSDDQPAAVQVADIGLINAKIRLAHFGSLDDFREKVKCDVAREAMRPLPIPIRDAIWYHYCYQ